MARRNPSRKKQPRPVSVPAPAVIRPSTWRRWRGWALLLTLTVGAFALWRFTRPPQPTPSPAVVKTEFPSLAELLAMPPEALAQVDIAVVNLRCAEGLHGSEGLDIAASRKALDQMAARVRRETERNFHRFYANSEEYQNSEPYFRLLMMAVVLQEDAGVQYNPSRMSDPGSSETNARFFANSQDVFIHGLTAPPMMGTCASLPVLYVAVGRRLGYPLRLVSAKNHLFVRWDDAQTRLNLDATSRGFRSESDDYYKTWPYPITEEEITANHHLVSMTPAEELACFMSIRGRCLFDGMGHYNQGIAAHREASLLAPEISAYRAVLNMAVEKLRARQAQQIMHLLDQADIPDFPSPQQLYQRRPNR